MISVNKKSYILILRQRERAKPLQKVLLNNGLNVIIEPIFKIKPVQFKPIELKKYQSLLITSVNAIKILSKNIEKKQLKNINTFCVGKVTEKYATKAGFNCIKTNATSGKTLTEEVIKHTKANSKKILIAGAQILSYNPMPKFKKNNINTERIIIYKKMANKKLSTNCSSLFMNNNIVNIVLYSPETAKIFLNLIKNYNTKNIQITCLGIKTKNILKYRNWKKIQVINNTKLKSFANNIINSNIN